MKRNLRILLVMLLCSGCATKPMISPDRWVEDYDYEQDFNGYLKAKFDEAVVQERVPYIYIYANWCPPCVRLRRESQTNPEFDKLFVETQIVLLNYDKLKGVENTPNYGGVPLIIPIEKDGALASRGINGIPWNRLPRDIEMYLCNFFEERRLTSSKLKRDCGEPSS
ncbi:MAG: thioredoxin family protein [Gammaproteobacteria bacterium]|nr:thioredoxin family protein [Gammaproteobacteria bacterium]MDP2348788.1 thioredoxin family protein [Gammaproteobacteria bacterium]